MRGAKVPSHTKPNIDGSWMPGEEIHDILLYVFAGGTQAVLGSIPNGADPMVEWFSSPMYATLSIRGSEVFVHL